MQRTVVVLAVVVVGWQLSYLVVPFSTTFGSCNPAVVSMWRSNSRGPSAVERAANDAELRALASAKFETPTTWTFSFGTPTTAATYDNPISAAALAAPRVFRACPPAAKHRVALHVPIVVLVAAVAGAALVLFRSRPERQPAT